MHLSRVHSQEPKPLSARRCQASGHVPSSWFLPTSTVSSARRLRVYCTPQSVMEFAAFSDWHRQRLNTTRRRCLDAGRLTSSPRDAVHTLRRLPLVDSRTVSRRPLPSCRLLPARYRADAEATTFSGSRVTRGRQGGLGAALRRTRGTRRRTKEPNSMMLRSAEADPHVTEHEDPEPPKRL
jgi:hypothetical protein